MNFFTEELQKIISLCPLIQKPVFTGKGCIFRLTDVLTVKMTFVTTGCMSEYNAIRVKIANRTDGEIDTETFCFKDFIWTGNNHKPYIYYSDPLHIWYPDSMTPTQNDYRTLADAISGYLNCFTDTAS